MTNHKRNARIVMNITFNNVVKDLINRRIKIRLEIRQLNMISIGLRTKEDSYHQHALEAKEEILTQLISDYSK